MIFFRKRKLRIHILTLFLFLFLTTISFIIFYSHSRSSAAVLKIGNTLIQHTHDNITQKFDDYLRPNFLSEVSHYLLSDHILNRSDMQTLASSMHIILQAYPQLINIYLTDNLGNMFTENHYRGPDDFIPLMEDENENIPAGTKYISEILANTPEGRNLTVEFKDVNGAVLGTLKKNHVDYDPLTRPWYLGAKQLKNEPWIGVYEFFGSQKKGISISFAVLVNNKMEGVAGADLNTSLISGQLKKFSQESQGIIFIVNNHNTIIAQEQDLRTKPKSKQTISEEFKNQLIDSAYQTHQQQKLNEFIFTFRGTKYIANFTPYAFNPEETWEIASIIPADTFVGDLKKTNEYILEISTLLLLIGTLLIIIFSHQISRPIIKVADATRDITKLDFDKSIHIDSHIYEVEVMVDALKATRSALSSFAKYVPKALVAQLIKGKIIAQLGGKKKIISILFTDIANFTETAEKTDPDLLILQISEYLNALTQQIQHYQGNIDKYIGDAIMAFWAAPLADSDHIYHACQATLACQRQVHELNRSWQAEGKPTFPTRFGLNTGVAIVGNMGSNDRLNYTAIGDEVNLAARLETLNKVYNTEIIVSEPVYVACADKFLFRPLDNVQVRGKQTPTAIYELVSGLENSEFPPTPDQVELCNLSKEAFHAYQEQNYRRAIQLFKKISEKFPGDYMANIYIERCKEFL